jgi:glycosyltransferase involved in cell wall biosynthesis
VTSAADMQGRPRLLYLVTEDWYFCSHRLPMARAARDAGFRVLVATRCGEHAERIREHGFEVHPLAWRRRAFDPVSATREIAEIAALYARTAPDVVHHVALKPVVYGTIAAGIARVPRVVNALTGFGFAFGSRGVRAAAAGGVLRVALRRVLDRRGAVVVVQNARDLELLSTEGLVDRASIRLVRGSGVDLGRFTPLPDPPEPFTLGYVGRMLADKGVPTLFEAVERVRASGLPVELVLAGAPDPENPTSLTLADLRALAARPGIHWLGRVDDVRDVWRRCHVAVLASRHEGLPLSLLEAAACGRAMIATDVAGCRELAEPGINALVVPRDDPGALADAIARLARDPDLRHRLAARARESVVAGGMGEETVAARMVGIYRELLASEPVRWAS